MTIPAPNIRSPVSSIPLQKEREPLSGPDSFLLCFMDKSFSSFPV